LSSPSGPRPGGRRSHVRLRSAAIVGWGAEWDKAAAGRMRS
jgi:hypothetical protein